MMPCGEPTAIHVRKDCAGVGVHCKMPVGTTAHTALIGRRMNNGSLDHQVQGFACLGEIRRQDCKRPRVSMEAQAELHGSGSTIRNARAGLHSVTGLGRCGAGTLHRDRGPARQASPAAFSLSGFGRRKGWDLPCGPPGTNRCSPRAGMRRTGAAACSLAVRPCHDTTQVVKAVRFYSCGDGTCGPECPIGT